MLLSSTFPKGRARACRKSYRSKGRSLRKFPGNRKMACAAILFAAAPVPFVAFREQREQHLHHLFASFTIHFLEATQLGSRRSPTFGNQCEQELLPVRRSPSFHAPPRQFFVSPARTSLPRVQKYTNDEPSTQRVSFMVGSNRIVNSLCTL